MFPSNRKALDWKNRWYTSTSGIVSPSHSVAPLLQSSGRADDTCRSMALSRQFKVWRHCCITVCCATQHTALIVSSNLRRILKIFWSNEQLLEETILEGMWIIISRRQLDWIGHQNWTWREKKEATSKNNMALNSGNGDAGDRIQLGHQREIGKG